MAHYTIDTEDGDWYTEGDYGEGLTCHLAAQRMALFALPEMALERMQGGDQGTFRAIVRDHNGEEIYTATLTLVGEWKVAPPAS